ncbi:arylsulfatase I-like [Amphiura filiformis]|uniref:arylsulfatase I-like n=1 Tax=Amphiura filiformis TaxID=82378 RepID=UPI003B213D07
MKGVVGVLLVMVTLAYVDADLKASLEKISRAEELVEILEDLEVEDRADDNGLAMLADDLEEKEEETLEKMVLEALEEKEEEKMLLETLKEQEDNNDRTARNAQPPHIIIILADDLGYNDVGYNKDGSGIETPKIDALAAEGVILRNYYVQPQCTPTRSQLLTGRYQIHTGLQHNVIEEIRPFCLPLNEKTIADKLREAGYKTHMVGKWHLGFFAYECTPIYRGFDSFLGFFAESTGYFDHIDSFQKSGIDISGYDFRRDNVTVWQDFANEYTTDIYTNRVKEIITSHNSNTPLFMFVSMQLPHTPLEVPRSYQSPFNQIMNTKSRKKLAGMISAMDESVGEIVDSLKENGLYDNSVIFFSSDNGAPPRFGNNWPMRGGKGTLFEGGIHAVGFINSPLLPAAAKSTTNNALIHVSDWFPTFVNLARGNLNGLAGPLDGFDMWTAIT